jgi:hypothetical protein
MGSFGVHPASIDIAEMMMRMRFISLDLWISTKIGIFAENMDFYFRICGT